MIRRVVRLVSGGIVVVAGSYWLLRYLRPRHSPQAFGGAVALIADADSVLGQAYAVALARRGARLALAGRNVDRLEALRLQVDPYAAGVLLINADWCDEAGRTAIIAQTLARYHQLGLLVMEMDAALPGGLLETVSTAAAGSALANAMALTQAALPAMQRRRTGVIVYTLPIAGWLAAPGLTLHSAAVYGIIGFATALRRELSDEGIAVVTVAAGPWSHETVPGALSRWLRHLAVAGVSPETVVESTLNGLLNGELDIFTGGTLYRILAWIERHLPWLNAAAWRALNSPEWLAAARTIGQSGQQ